jgi:eukaryotic-like serine/threonine-protein kinase
MLTSGTSLGPYKILASLDAGGMGEVYRAHDTRLGRDVAVKVLSPRLAATPEARARFEREARTISQLSHPHICTLYDVGHQDGIDYLVMELLEGETLAHRLEKGPLPVADILALGAQIADALDRAHRAGVVHRDLKPGNVMLTKSGARLMDFGLARPFPEAGGSATLTDSPTMTCPLTAEGTIVGTFPYMAPEQLEGKEADARADLWALGCVLYEMATGKLAFEGTSQASLIAAILKETPRPVTDLQPLIPPALERIVRHCLEKDPDQRFQSARDLVFDLGTVSGVADGRPHLTRRPARSEILAWGIAGLAVVGAIVMVMAMRGKVPVASEPLVSSIIPPANSVSCFRDGFALSPDGRKLAFVSLSAQSERQVWLRHLDLPDAAPIPGTDDASYPFWSSDSKEIAFYAGGHLKRVSADGGPVQEICRADLVGSNGGSWGSSGFILFSSVSGWISRVSATGGDPARLSIGRANFPYFLPDGRKFLCIRYQGSQSSVYLTSLDKPGTGREVAGTGGATKVEWAPGDRLVFWLGADRSLVAQRVDLGSCRALGGRKPLAERVPAPAEWPLFSLSGEGTAAFVVNPPEARNDYASRLVWVDRAGNQVGFLGEIGGYWYARISPDGRRVAVNPNDDIWIVDVATGVPTRLTMEMDKGGYACKLVWSPGGDRAVSFMNGTIEEIAIHGDQPREIWKGGRSTDWSRDGRYLAIDRIADEETRGDLVFFDREDLQIKPFLASGADEFGGVFSPDGRWIAYASNETGSFEVYVRAFPGGDRLTRVSRAGGMHPRWRADGRELFFLAPGWTMMATPVQLQPEFTMGAPTALFQMVMADIEKGTGPPYDVTPDGQRFLVISPQTKPVPLTLVLNWSAYVDR